MVERANKKIKDVLRTVITPRTEDWDLALEDVQFTVNNTVSEVTNETSHFLLYDHQKQMPLTLLDDAKSPKQIYDYKNYGPWKQKLTFDIT